ncbi:MAG: hypothetical protein IPL01_22725 [Acidobacteria bacterium]|nr:hypothetical protein [Acidobacteriota bacterium]
MEMPAVTPIEFTATKETLPKAPGSSRRTAESVSGLRLSAAAGFCPDLQALGPVGLQ